jgi:protein TonB
VAGATLDAAVSGPLVPALAVSVALHAAVLAGWPDLWTPASVPEPPLMAWLAPGAPAAPAPETAPAAPPQPSVVAPLPPRARPKAAPPPSPAPIPAVVALSPPVAAPPPAESIGVAAAAPATPAPRLASVDTRAAPTGAPSAPPAEDAGSLIAQYRVALLGAATREKLYPPGAVDRGWAGRVDLRLVIGAAGELARAEIVRSSGHDVLDRQTLATFRAAHARTPVPPALRDREFAVDVAVRYELKGAR